MEEALRRAIEAAAAAGPESLLALWQEQRRAGASGPEAATLVAKLLVGMARPDDALAVLEHAGDGLRARQLRGLALNKADRLNEAIAVLAALRAEGARDAETGGLLGGCYKRRGQEHDNPTDLQAAYEIYRETYAATGDSYPGINVASLALALGEREESARVAADVLQSVTLPPDRMDVWTFATRGEAHLLLGQLPDARTWYRRAVAANPNAAGSIATMRRQARANLLALGLEAGALDDVLHIRTVVAFTGHMTDAPGRAAARFPPGAEGAVRRAIRDRLKQMGAGFAFSSAARGADVLFLEEMLDRGASARVFLPFAYERFVETSIGAGWRARVDRILADPRVTLVTLPGQTDDGQLAASFEACAAAVADAARRFARGLGDEPAMLAVWDGLPGDGGGGTADAVQAWRASGDRAEVIAPMDRPDATTAAPAAATGVTRDIVRPAGGHRRTELPFSYAHRHCLCIGVDEYAGRAWPRLNNARRDAEVVGQVLADRHGFTEPLFLRDAEATSKAMNAVITGELRRRATADDLVVVFFAGHGHTKQMGGQEHGFIVPVDARSDEPAELISVKQLAEWNTYLECRHLLYVFDSCFSGMFQRVAGGDRMTPDASRARMAITSGQADQPVFDGGGSEGHSVFASGLLHALRNGIDGRVEYTATELYSHLRRHVAAAFPQQTPTLATLPNHEGGEVLLRRLS